MAATEARAKTRPVRFVTPLTCRWWGRSFRQLFQLLHLRLGGFGGERQILSVSHHLCLAFLADHEAQKLAYLGIHRLARRSICIGVDPRIERIRAIVERLQRVRDVRSTVLYGDGEDLQRGRQSPTAEVGRR